MVTRSQTRRALEGSASVTSRRGKLVYRDGSQSRAPRRRGLVLGAAKMFWVLGNAVGQIREAVTQGCLCESELYTQFTGLPCVGHISINCCERQVST